MRFTSAGLDNGPSKLKFFAPFDLTKKFGSDKLIYTLHPFTVSSISDVKSFLQRTVIPIPFVFAY